MNLKAIKIEEYDDHYHLFNSIDTPLREDAFKLDDETKKEVIEDLFKQIMVTMGLDLSDDSLKETPKRVAKMFVSEIFHGLNPANKPDAKLFDNKYQYGQMLVEKNINVYSTCEHHFLPIWGKAHIAYISSGKVVGLSKLNRIVDYYSRRPQVQERLTIQIARELQDALETDDVAVFIEARHMCVASRGIQDKQSTTITTEFTGKFQNPIYQDKFFSFIQHKLMD